MATLQDVLSPQARIDGLDQTPVTDPLAPAMLAGLTDAPRTSATGPGPGSGVKAPTAPKTPTLASRNIYGPRIYVGGSPFGRTAPEGDPNAGLAPRIAALATSPAGAPRGFLASPVGSVLRSSLYALGQNLPVGAGGIGNFLGSAGRAFTSSVDAQEAQRAQSAQAAQAANEAAFQRQLQGAQLGLLNAQADRLRTPTAKPDQLTFVNEPGIAPYILDVTTGERRPVAGAPTRPLSSEAPLTPHQIATERRGVRSDRAKQANDLRLNANDVLNGQFKGLSLGDLSTGADSSAYSDAQGMRQHADWLASHPLSVPQVDSVRAGTLDFDNYPGAKSPTPQLAPNVRADQLRSQGLNADAIKAQMAKEGYRIKGVNAQ